MRRRALLPAIAAITALPVWARADEPRLTYLRIATGAPTGTYYRIGGVLAEIVSAPPGTPPCAPGAACGVPSLVAVAQTAPGSVANVAAVEAGLVETGLVQADVAFWAYKGSMLFAGQVPAEHLRALAALYRESVHVVVRAAAPIAGIADLRGRRVAIDEPGSGTRVEAQIVLNAYGLGKRDLDLVDSPTGASRDALKAGRLDAFFLVAGWPIPAITELVRSGTARLLPLRGPDVDKLLAMRPFLSRDVIPASAYPGQGAVETIGVRALWVASERLEDRLVEALLRSIWHPDALARLAVGHPRGADIHLETALDGVAIPLHRGAARFYTERGLLPRASAP